MAPVLVVLAACTDSDGETTLFGGIEPTPGGDVAGASAGRGSTGGGGGSRASASSTGNGNTGSSSTGNSGVHSAGGTGSMAPIASAASGGLGAAGGAQPGESAEGMEGTAPLPLLPDPGPVVPDDGEQTWVFDPSVVHTYYLSLDPEVWAELQRNARDEEYTPAEFVAGGQQLSRVGLRFKGSLGTLVSCFADDGSLRCKKLSMKLEFDEYVDDQRFFGLRRLNFNSMLYDDTRMHERLAYRVYRELGLVAPRSAHARLIINGEDWGLFSLVEEVDGRFTDHHFEQGDGNLYKEAWPGNTPERLLDDALKTNEELADHSVFQQFDAELRSASLTALPAVVERYLEVDAMLAYLAVDQALVNWDGITAFYCYGASYCENHNYYLYQAELEPRFTLIPWDLDNTFESSPLTGVPGVLSPPADCSLRYDATGRSLMAPGCDLLLRGLVTGRASRYAAHLQRLLDGPLAPGVIEGWIDELTTLLEPEVQSDARGPSVGAFTSAVARLRSSLPGLREHAQQESARLR